MKLFRWIFLILVYKLLNCLTFDFDYYIKKYAVFEIINYHECKKTNRVVQIVIQGCESCIHFLPIITKNRILFLLLLAVERTFFNV